MAGSSRQLTQRSITLRSMDATRLAALRTHMDADLEADRSGIRAEPRRKRNMKTRRSKYHTSETARDMADRNLQMDGSLKSMTAGDLGAIIKALVERTKIDPERIDDVVSSGGGTAGIHPRRSARPPLRFRPPSGDRRCHAHPDRRGRHGDRRRRRKHVQCGILFDRSPLGGRLARPDQECSPRKATEGTLKYPPPQRASRRVPARQPDPPRTGPDPPH